MSVVPAHIAEMAARLPATYEQARKALAECLAVDECKDWADKAEALASYARQADDRALMDYALRVKARAIQRAGQLLKEFDARGDHRKSGVAPTSSQRQAAEAAGLSKDQQVQAVRVANVPLAVFDHLVEEERPVSTVSALAEMGRQAQSRPEPPPGFRAATHYMGAIRRLSEICDQHPPAEIRGGLQPQEADEVRELSATVALWLGLYLQQEDDDA